MANTPELYWKMSTTERGTTRMEFVTMEQARIKGLLGQVLAKGEANAYVKISPQTYQSYADWKRKNR